VPKSSQVINHADVELNANVSDISSISIIGLRFFQNVMSHPAMCQVPPETLTIFLYFYREITV
jgi:hypothetical protein